MDRAPDAMDEKCVWSLHAGFLNPKTSEEAPAKRVLRQKLLLSLMPTTLPLPAQLAIVRFVIVIDRASRNNEDAPTASYSLLLLNDENSAERSPLPSFVLIIIIAFKVGLLVAACARRKNRAPAMMLCT